MQVSTLSPPVLEVMDVDFKYPTGPTILKDVNFGLDQTSRVCIVGPNGAGAAANHSCCCLLALSDVFVDDIVDAVVAAAVVVLPKTTPIIGQHDT